jgi:hypothetical protein
MIESSNNLPAGLITDLKYNDLRDAATLAIND